MIDLTPIDVRKKKGDFKRAVRGYDTDLVDDFLDLVAERLEELVKQNMSLTDRLSRIEEQVGEYRQRDRAMTEALVSAQEVREEVRRQAEKDAELIKREAEADAQRMRSELAASLEREEDNLRRLRARRLQMIQSFRNFLERELSELAVTEDALEMEQDEPTRAVKPKAGARPRAKAAAAPETAASELDEDDSPLPLMGESTSSSSSSQPSSQPSTSSKEEQGPDWLSTIMEDRK